MKFLQKLLGWLWPFKKGYTVVYFEGDELPDVLAPKKLTVAREDDELWLAGMICPCGCGARLEMILLKQAKPRWDLKVDQKNRATLHPSVWRNKECKSHFWLRDGKVVWCREGNGRN